LPFKRNLQRYAAFDRLSSMIDAHASKTGGAGAGDAAAAANDRGGALQVESS
jgi:hypothetical protein